MPVRPLIWLASPLALLVASPAAAISCSMSASPLAFGNYNAITKAQVTSTTTLTVVCTGPGTLTYAITISSGQSGNALSRYLLSGANQLPYNLYRDTTRTQVIGSGAGGTYTISGTSSLPSGSVSGYVSLYGAIPAGQNPVPGSYTDTLLVTFTY